MDSKFEFMQGLLIDVIDMANREGLSPVAENAIEALNDLRYAKKNGYID
jgi:hypothetical protein